jgi:signal transduction histidine kinase
VTWKLGKESFVVSALTLTPDQSPPVIMIVLKSYDEATAFLNELQQLLLAVGLGAVLAGSLLVYFVASTFTRPLERLVDGVRALGRGDFRYPLHVSAAGEVAELTEAFTRMRDSLRQAQQRLLDAERLATIGRMASSISHDLRHPLTAVLANAEFLADAELTAAQREELYLEIRVAVNRLTDLVDSLLELSRPAESLNAVETPVERTISRAIELVRAHRQFQRIAVAIDSNGLHTAQFDPRKMERVFYNLLLNSCQAAQVCGGHVGVRVSELNGDLRIQIIDDGPGVEASIRDKLFQPFVSFGKENGTGLGLTIAQKIVQDHSGALQLESSTYGRTVMQILLPRVCRKVTAETGKITDNSQSFTT